MIAEEVKEPLSATAKARLTRRKRLVAKESASKLLSKTHDGSFAGNIDLYEQRDEGSEVVRNQATGRCSDTEERKHISFPYHPPQQKLARFVLPKSSHTESGLVSLKEEILKSQCQDQEDRRDCTSFADSDVESEGLSSLSQDGAVDEDGGLIWDVNTAQFPFPNIPFPEVSERTLERLDMGSRVLMDIFEKSSELAIGTMVNDESCFRIEGSVVALPLLEHGVQKDWSSIPEEGTCDESRFEESVSKYDTATVDMIHEKRIDPEFSEERQDSDEDEKYTQPEAVNPECPPGDCTIDMDDLESILDGSPSTSENTLSVLEDLKNEEKRSESSLPIPETKSSPSTSNDVATLRGKGNSVGIASPTASSRRKKGVAVQMKCIGSNKSARVLCIAPVKQTPNRYVPPPKCAEFKNRDPVPVKHSWHKYGFGRLKHKTPAKSNHMEGEVEKAKPDQQTKKISTNFQNDGRDDSQKGPKGHARGLKEVHGARKENVKYFPIKASGQSKSLIESTQQLIKTVAQSRETDVSQLVSKNKSESKPEEDINFERGAGRSNEEKTSLFPVKIDVLFHDIDNAQDRFASEEESKVPLHCNTEIKSISETIDHVSSTESSDLDTLSHSQPHFAQLVVGRQSLDQMPAMPVDFFVERTLPQEKKDESKMNEEQGDVNLSISPHQTKRRMLV